MAKKNYLRTRDIKEEWGDVPFPGPVPSGRQDLKAWWGKYQNRMDARTHYSLFMGLDGLPFFRTREEAIEFAENNFMGKSFHVHRFGKGRDLDGGDIEVYMPGNNHTAAIVLSKLKFPKTAAEIAFAENIISFTKTKPFNRDSDMAVMMEAQLLKERLLLEKLKKESEAIKKELAKRKKKEANEIKIKNSRAAKGSNSGGGY
jgi:hypothetical protein